MRVFLKNKHALAYFEEQATSDFWDKHWNSHTIANQIKGFTTDRTFIPNAKKFVPKGATILEGGCGNGQIVHALRHQGYKAIGIDFAEKTVNALNAALPELDIRVGDVRCLPIQDRELDGYISGGVIEHFWEGYDAIISEMGRVIKSGGYLFITFPYMSPLRKLKVLLNLYPESTSDQYEKRRDNFYQFALDRAKVVSDIEEKGFQFLESRSTSGLKGFKDEVKFLQPLLQKIYDGDIKIGPLRSLLDLFFRPFAGHTLFLVFKRK